MIEVIYILKENRNEFYDHKWREIDKFTNKKEAEKAAKEMKKKYGYRYKISCIKEENYEI